MTHASRMPARAAAAAIARCAAALLTCAAAMPAWGQWKPQKPIEIVVSTSPGSGLDTMARTLAAILREGGFVEPSVSILNRPGGAMAVGLGHVAQRPGDGHVLFMNVASVLSAHITGQSKFNYTDFTPLAQLATEPIVFVVAAQSPIQSGRILVAQLQKDPASVSLAFSTTRGDTAHIAIALAGRSAGADIRRLKTVVFNSAGDATAAALGGHVDVAVGTPANLVPLMEAGKLRMIAISSEQRLGGKLKDVPTWREQGIDAVVTQWRGVLGAHGLTQEQIAFWDATLEKLTRTAAWKAYLEKHQFPDAYANSERTGQQLKAEYATIRDILSQLGMAK
jgi:putative tricarboxylic transport membrane protein